MSKTSLVGFWLSALPLFTACGGDSKPQGAAGSTSVSGAVGSGGHASGGTGAGTSEGGSGEVASRGGSDATAHGGTTGASTGGAAGRGGSPARGGSTAASGGANSGGNPALGGAGDCSGAGCTPPQGLLDPDRTTAWNPGILQDTQLNLPLGGDGIPARTTICASPKPSDDLNAAISGCPAGQVVQLAAGTYKVSSAVTLNKGVVLRGAGSQGAASGGTTIVRSGGGSVLSIGTGQDQACYNSAYDTAYPLTETALKETAVIHLAANAAKFSVGDLALIDQVDDATVQEGDCQYFKRVDKRSVSERVEVTAVDTANGTVRLTSPLHWTFKSASPYAAQIARVAQPLVKWVGVEDLAIQGGTNPGYNGQMAGGIEISNAAYCWVKNVQTDGTIGGMHVAMTGTYRCVVRDSHFHNSANYGFGTDCYGIVLRCGAADNLVENNIARYMNKPILFNVSGGGNVIGYNYADNSWATPAAWQEVNIDTHCSFPHMELIEGNYAPHMGATITHGNAGYLTFFRNYSSSQFAAPAVYGSTTRQTGNIAALQFDTGDLNMSVIGNVLGSAAASDLGTAPVSQRLIGENSDTPCIYEFGENGTKDIAYSTLWSHGNYDSVSAQVVWNSAIETRELPASLYLRAKPAWWPNGQAWPWVGPELTPRVQTLPAKARSDAIQ